jgi:hypothetical protein
MGKRKRSYIDNYVRLQVEAKPQNVLRGIVALECDRRTVGSLERHFKYKLEMKDDIEQTTKRLHLTAMVMNNDIVVLVIKDPVKVVKVEFNTQSDSETVSGKKKLGARRLAAGSVVARITLENGIEKELLTPVG